MTPREWVAIPLQAVMILALSLGATLSAWKWVREQGQTLERIRFTQVAEEAVGELRDRMSVYEQSLRAGVALFEASDGVTRDEWKRFVARLDIEHRLPGLQGLGFAIRVDGPDLAAHQARVRDDGFPDYAVTPPGDRPVNFVILYLEPFSGRNLRAFGYDMFSEPTRRHAMEAARDSGEARLTAKVTLVQETSEEVQAGALLYLPFYGRGVPAGIEDRRASIRGFVYAPFRMGDLTRSVLGDRLDRLCLSLFDEVAAPETQLFANTDCTPGQFSMEQRIDLFGRTWVARVTSTPALDDMVASRRSVLILSAGIIISVLLMWAVLAMVAERRRRLALARANADLELARARAAGADAAKGRFLAAASHDLRQPMQSLGLYLHILVGQCDAASREAGRAAQQAFEATTRMLDAMFDIAALEGGRSQPSPRRCDVAALVGQVAVEVAPEAESRGLSLRSRLRPASLETDPVMLERIVRNLLSNAVKYTESGAILVTCRPWRGGAVIRVIDTGRGIPPDRRDLVFEDFYQLENPDRDPRKGLGMGLATVARLCRLLGYKIRLRSSQGRGSAFTVELPGRLPTRS